MTAYGRSTLASLEGRFVAEVHSVNKRFLEINVHLPRELQRFERELKKCVAEKITRGQVNVLLSAQLNRGNILNIKPNLPLVRQLKEAWDQVKNELGMPSSQDFDLRLLASEKGLLQYEEDFEDEKSLFDSLHEVLMKALERLLLMKNEEGESLFKDLASRIPLIEERIDLIEKNASGATKRYREKLLANLEDLVQGSVEKEERVLREVAFFAERVDITEEITRFRLHLKKFLHLFNGEGAVGKTLEFMIQEMHREVNTIGSKSSDATISHWVVDIKGELEKIREQIQNVE